jgi:hypothetical protein
MNSYTLNISSTTTGTTTYLTEIDLFDVTTFNLDFNNVTQPILATRLLLDWGDGSAVEEYEKSLYKNYRTSSIFSEILYGREGTLLTDTYSHIFYPSNKTLQLKLSSQIVIVFADNTQNRYIVPLNIRCGSFYETIYDLNLVDTNMLTISTNNINFVFTTTQDGYIIEGTN